MLQDACVLLTGAASGIGRQLAVDLAGRKCSLTLVDLDEAGARETLALVERAGGRGQVVRCNVASVEQQEAAFKAHASTYGRLDAAILNAGIMEKGDITRPCPDHDYLATLDVNLKAVVIGANLAAVAMTSLPVPGPGQQRRVIMMTASAGGMFPMPHAPVYAAAKAGVVHLARSLAPRLKGRGVDVCALCPQYADTALVRNAMREWPGMREYVDQDTGGRIMGVDQVSAAGLWLLDGAGERCSSSGLALFVSGKNGKWYVWPEMKAVGGGGGPAGMPALSSHAHRRDTASGALVPRELPREYRKIELYRLSTDWGTATRLVTAQMPRQVPAGHVIIRRLYAGVNASDINFSAGRYFRGKSKPQLPVDAGFEAVGVVAAVGPGVDSCKVGDGAATMTYGAFSEYSVVDARQVLPVADPSAGTLGLLVSGLTASIGLEQCGGVRKGSTVMVTAAAGGTGQFAVQLAKIAGATVIATCSDEAKAARLRELGADRVINYKTEDVRGVLKAEYPQGLDLVYESVGGDMFSACVDALATGGRLIIIGMIGSYSGEWKPSVHPGLAEKLLWKSASIMGFFLLNHTRLFRAHLQRLEKMHASGQLQVGLETAHSFVGLESVSRAEDLLHSGRSSGKVFVQIPHELHVGGADSHVSGQQRAKL